MRRPTSVTVFGVLNIVFGALGLLGVAFSAVALFAGIAMAEAMDPFPNADPVWNLWIKVSIVLGVVAVIVLIASGIGLLNLRPWGRTLAIGYSIYAIVAGLVGTAMQLSHVVQPTLEQFQAQGGPEATAALVIVMGGLFGGCIGLVYPALLWYYMTRQHVVAAFSGILPAQVDAYWSPPTPEPWSPVESNNPYVPPRTAVMPPVAPVGTSPGLSESIVETFIPSQNGPALVSYYLGIFSLIPCLGFPLGVVAVYYGVKGLRRVRENPAVRGGAHAWVGIICGSLFGLFSFLFLALAVVGIIGAALDK